MPATPLALEAIPLIHSANYTPANRKAVDLIVIHSMESPEVGGTARNVAQWMAGDRAPEASAHYFVDPLEVLRGVRDEEIAWHAPGVNARSIGIEHAGRASQTADQWRDEDSSAILARSIELSALLCAKWSIPAVIVLSSEMEKGRGITTHALVTKAFPKLGTHWDPGPNFPLDWYVGRVAARLVPPEAIT